MARRRRAKGVELLIRNISRYIGASFCQVKRIIHADMGIAFIEAGSQKNAGAIPSFIIIPLMMKNIPGEVIYGVNCINPPVKTRADPVA